jgi:hypothetical protein
MLTFSSSSQSSLSELTHSIIRRLNPVRISGYIVAAFKKLYNDKWKRKGFRKIVICRQNNSSGYLASLCDKYGSDKGSNMTEGHCYPWAPHTYSDVYSLLFDMQRHQIKAVFECGIGTRKNSIPANMGNRGAPGASLRVWRDYFLNAQIYGVDIDKDILFTDERINTCYMDQTDKESIRNALDHFGDVKYDIIIDDGLHTFNAGIILFEECFERLTSRGVYIIEDVYLDDREKFLKYFASKNLDVHYISTGRQGEALGTHSLIHIANN